MKKLATLRTCASCEWIFKINGDNPSCSKCGFGSYGARYVYGRNAYRFAKTQRPWFEKKMAAYASKLLSEIKR